MNVVYLLLKPLKKVSYGGPLQQYYDLSGFEKFKGYNLKVFLIDPGYFFLEKYIKNGRIERKVLSIWLLP